MILNALLATGILGAFWIILHLMRKDTYQRGKIEEQNQALKGTIDDVERVKIARDALVSDPNGNVSKFVRDKYTRPKT